MNNRRWQSRPRGADGFTLVELSVAMSITGVLLSIGAFGFASWLNTSRHQGTSDQIVSQLRNASTRASTEGRTYCLEVSNGGRAYSLWRYKCSTAAPSAGDPVHARVVPVRSTQARSVTVDVTLDTPLAAGMCPNGSECVYFYPRGTATQGELAVASTRRPGKTYTINVEGLTARVYV